MIEVTCQTCAAKVGVQSFLAAAQQPCGRCGQLLMGPLAHGNRVARPGGFVDLPAPSRPLDFGSGSPASLWLSMCAGALVGLGVVVAVALLGPAIPPPVRGALLGALTGVLLAPVIAVASFLAMLGGMLFGLAGLFGESIWSRVGKAMTERRIRPLFIPFFVCVVLPMGLCGVGGSRMKAADSPLLVTAGLGAIVLGAVVGGVCGAFASRRDR
jgi:hypothetical protein